MRKTERAETIHHEVTSQRLVDPDKCFVKRTLVNLHVLMTRIGRDGASRDKRYARARARDVPHRCDSPAGLCQSDKNRKETTIPQCEVVNSQREENEKEEGKAKEEDKGQSSITGAIIRDIDGTRSLCRFFNRPFGSFIFF